MTGTKGPINLVLLGPPGAGKGTQAVLLTGEYGFLHISTGDMLREAVKSGSKSGTEAAEHMNRGELVPDDIVTHIVMERMNRPDAAGGIILDGYPRNVSQAESLDNSFRVSGKVLDLVLYFKTSEEVAVQRLSGRRVCRKCAKNYHVTNMPPKQEGICDNCGGELFQREDDKADTVKNRLSVYDASTRDLVGYYRDKGSLREVNGDIPARDLFEDIKILFHKEGLI